MLCHVQSSCTASYTTRIELTYIKIKSSLYWLHCAEAFNKRRGSPPWLIRLSNTALKKRPYGGELLATLRQVLPGRKSNPRPLAPLAYFQPIPGLMRGGQRGTNTAQWRRAIGVWRGAGSPKFLRCVTFCNLKIKNLASAISLSSFKLTPYPPSLYDKFHCFVYYF